MPPGDAIALAGAVRRVPDEAELASRLAAAGRERADEFDSCVVAGRIEEVYREVAPAS